MYTGYSTQSTDYQMKLKQRLVLKYDLPCNARLVFMRAMSMPKFEWEGMGSRTGVTLTIEEGR